MRTVRRKCPYYIPAVYRRPDGKVKIITRLYWEKKIIIIIIITIAVAGATGELNSRNARVYVCVTSNYKYFSFCRVPCIGIYLILYYNRYTSCPFVYVADLLLQAYVLYTYYIIIYLIICVYSVQPPTSRARVIRCRAHVRPLITTKKKREEGRKEKKHLIYIYISVINESTETIF